MSRDASFAEELFVAEMSVEEMSVEEMSVEDKVARKMQPLRIGTLGTARITPLALLRPARQTPDVAVVAIAARDRRRAFAFAAKEGIPTVHASYADLLADPAIDAIYNPLPNSLHGEWTVRALRAGKHVLCEKPLAANADEAVAMATVAAAADRVLMEAFHPIYHPLAERMRAIVASGELGPIRHVEAHFCTLMWRRNDIRLSYDLGGGALMDLGCYPVRLVRHVLQAEPRVVGATATCHTPQVDRKMVLDLQIPQPNGTDISGRITCAFWSRRLLRITLKVVGEAGEMHVVNPVLPHLLHWVRVRTATGTRVERSPGQSTYAGQLHAFVQSIRSGGEENRDRHGWDGVANMRVIDAAYRAAGLALRQPHDSPVHYAR